MVASSSRRSSWSSPPTDETVVSHERVAAPAEDHLGDDERRVAGLVGEREACRRPPGRCPARRRRCARWRARSISRHQASASANRLAPVGRISAATPAADQAVAAAQPGDRMVLGEHVEQRGLGRELERDGADDEGRGGRLPRDVRGGAARHKGRGYPRPVPAPDSGSA